MMPDLGGVRVLEELGSDPVLAGVPVIVVTGRVDAVSDLERLLGAGMVFVKPFAVDELVRRVAELIGGPARPSRPSP
jgi:DNA-binding response OmpR family regulator